MSDPTAILLAGRSKDSQDAMPVIEEFLRAVGNRLRARLVNRTSSDIQVDLQEVVIQSIEAIKRSDEMSADGVFGLLRFDSSQRPGVVTLERGMLTRVIGAMLGDDQELAQDDDEAEEEDGARPLSPVEQRIAHRMFRDMLSDVVDSWPMPQPPDMALDGHPGNSRIIDLQSGEEEVVSATFMVGMEEDEFGKLVVGIPTHVLRTAGQPKDRNKKKDSAPSKPPQMSRVMPVEVEVVAEMARLPMRVRDLHNLQSGDLLPLGPMDAAVVRVNGRALMQGEPGHANGQRSIRIRKKIT
jgi:flagellar motor switch protein FliM